MKTLILTLTFFACLNGYADTLLPASPVPSISGLPVSVVNVASTDETFKQWLNDIFNYMRAFGGLAFMLKISGLVTLVLATLKVSIIRQYTWDKVPVLKPVAGPILSFIVGFITIESSKSTTFTWAAVAAYTVSGSGSIIMHQILDGLKGIPGIAPVYVNMINFFNSLLGGTAPAAVSPALAATTPAQNTAATTQTPST